MATMSSTDAKTHFNEVLSRVVTTGEDVTVTKHGRPVAVISRFVPPGRRWGAFPGIDLAGAEEPMSDEELADWGE